MQIGRTFAVRNRTGLQHGPIGLHDGLELEEQPRFSDSRLSHDGDDLTGTCLSALSRALQHFLLLGASYKLGKAATGRPLQPRAQWSQAHYFVDIDRLADPLHMGWTERAQCEIALDEFPRAIADDGGSSIGERLQPRSKIYGVSYRRVLGM